MFQPFPPLFHNRASLFYRTLDIDRFTEKSMVPHHLPGNLELDFEFRVRWIRRVHSVDSVFLVSLGEVRDFLI